MSQPAAAVLAPLPFEGDRMGAALPAGRDPGGRPWRSGPRRNTGRPRRNDNEPRWKVNEPTQTGQLGLCRLGPLAIRPGTFLGRIGSQVFRSSAPVFRLGSVAFRVCSFAFRRARLLKQERG